MPILTINEEKDVQVTSNNLREIEQAVKNKELITIVEYPGMNHLFQECMNCLISKSATSRELNT